MNADSGFDDDQLNWLAHHGIDLRAALTLADLPKPLRLAIEAAGVSTASGSSLLVFANAGPSLWRAMKRDMPKVRSSNPVDHYSAHLGEAYIDRFLSDHDSRIVYPSDLPVPLIALGEYCGWSSPSRLGMGIHADYGLWFAYRTVIVTTASVLQTRLLPATDVCADCSDKPCIAVCPADAVSVTDTFALESCSRFRLNVESPCELTCLSRVACPVGHDHRYDAEQLAHHMGRSLPGLRAYFGED